MSHCKLEGQCSGCPWITRSYPDQIDRKKSALLELLKVSGIPHLADELKVATTAPFGLRDRVDLTLTTDDQGVTRLGLYHLTKNEIVDMPACPQMSPALEKWFLEFRKSLPPLKIGSVRLRVAPDGTRGVWLDLANIDVKTLLDEKTWLESLFNQSIVEIGQRRKRLVKTAAGLKLGDPEIFGWFNTYVTSRLLPSRLFLSIGGFSQPSFEANKTLIDELRKVVTRLNADRWLEIFAGNGNLTLPLASWGKKVTAFEIDYGAIDGLRKSAAETELTDKIEVVRGDAYRLTGLPPFENFDALLVDPPRSGLKQIVDLLKVVSHEKKPRHIVYVSCFAESFAEDAKRLLDQGYQLKSLVGVDQFPQSPHCEWIGRFSL